MYSIKACINLIINVCDFELEQFRYQWNPFYHFDKPFDKMKESFRQIEKEYHKLAGKRGTIIRKITRIERKEDGHFLFEYADFSINTIKKVIKQGEGDAENALTTR